MKCISRLHHDNHLWLSLFEESQVENRFFQFWTRKKQLSFLFKVWEREREKSRRVQCKRQRHLTWDFWKKDIVGTALVNHGVKWERTGHTSWLNFRHNDVYRYIKRCIIERIFNLNKERSRQERKREEMEVEEGIKKRGLFNSLPLMSVFKQQKNKSQFSFNHRYLSFPARQGIDCILHFSRLERERQAFDRMPILSLLKQQLLFTLLSSSASKALITRGRKREKESCLENFENLLLKRCYN